MESTTNTSGGAPQPTPFLLLDYLVPGFSVVSSTINTYLGIDLNVYLPILIFVFGSIYSWNYIAEYSHSCVSDYLMSSVTLRKDDEIYKMVMAWIARQAFAKRSRSILVNSSTNTRSWYLWSYRNHDEDEDEDDDFDNVVQKPLQYTPAFGSHYFWYKGRLLNFQRCQDRERSGSSYMSDNQEQITIQCFGRNPQILKDLLLEARVEHAKKDEDKTIIYRGSVGTYSEPVWQRCMSRTGRPFSTVILDEKIKTELVEDVSDYLNPDTRRWYSNRGIPYRRGYLFYGPPGTGKSSLSLAMAGYFHMRIYMVSLNSSIATEENLTTLFSELPRRCCVLLEDIDSAGL